MSRALACIALAGAAACGRIGFDAISASGDGGGPAGDAPGEGDGGAATADDIPDLVVAYPMDDDPSTGMVRSTVPAYDATCVGCPGPIAGVLAGAYAFDNEAIIDLPATASGLIGGSSYTLALWLRTDATSPETTTTVLSKQYGTGAENVLNLWFTHGDGRIHYETTAYDIMSSPEGLDLRGAWRHVALTWDGTTKRLHVDGVEVASAAVVAADDDRGIVIGCDVDSGTRSRRYFGDLDDLRFYARALDAGEVALLAAPP